MGNNYQCRYLCHLGDEVVLKIAMIEKMQRLYFYFFS